MHPAELYLVAFGLFLWLDSLRYVLSVPILQTLLCKAEQRMNPRTQLSVVVNPHLHCDGKLFHGDEVGGTNTLFASHLPTQRREAKWCSSKSEGAVEPSMPLFYLVHFWFYTDPLVPSGFCSAKAKLLHQSQLSPTCSLEHTGRNLGLMCQNLVPGQDTSFKVCTAALTRF